MIVVLHGEPDHDAGPLRGPEMGADVRGGLEANRARAILLLELMGAAPGGPVITHRRSHDSSMALIEPGRGRREHLPGADDAPNLHAGGIGQLDRSGHQQDVVPARSRGGGNGVPHPAAGGIGDEPDRVKELAGRAGRMENPHDFT